MTDLNNGAPSTPTTLPYRGEIGVQFSLVPASDQFIPIILAAIEGLDRVEGLSVSPDKVSTYMAGTVDVVFGALTTTFVRASQSGAHIVQPLLASRGCPGWEGKAATVSAADGGSAAALALANFVPPASSGIEASAQFALLPMGDANYIEIIASSLTFLSEVGLQVQTKNLVTRVDGDAALVLAAFATILTHFGAPDGHVVLNATLVANSPTEEAYA